MSKIEYMDLEVVPDNWVLPNRISYNKFAYDTFHASKYKTMPNKRGCECANDVCEIPSVSLFPQQRIVRDFIQVNSPYRGVLLYHELGSGKSAASIAAAEGYVGKRRVFVLTPASLAQNYENELMKISTLGLNLKKSWTQLKVEAKDPAVTKILKEKYAITPDIIKKDGLVWVPLYKDGDIPYATTIISGKSYSALSTDEKTRINDTIVHIIRNRYSFISYNGLTQKLVSELTKTGFSNSFIIIDEVHNFISRIVNGSKLARSVYNAIMAAKDCKLVLLSGTPIINNPYEVATLINLIRGPMSVHELRLLKNSIEPTDDLLVEKLKTENVYEYVDEIHYNKDKNNIYLLLMPYGYARENNMNKIVVKEWKMTINKLIENIINVLKGIKGLKVGVVPSASNFYALPNSKDEFNKYFIDVSDPDNPKVRNIDLFQRRILGTLSYYRISGTEYFPTVLPNNIQYLPMTDHQFSAYADVRAKERAMDDAQRRHNTDVMSEKSSVYRAFSRMVCNFSFPEEVKRMFPQDVKKLMKKEVGADDDDSDDEDESKEDKKMLKKVRDEYENSLNKAMKEIVKGDYLQKNNLSKLYSPKYAKMLDDIDESPGTVLIYSQFRTMEGLGIFSKVLDIHGFKEIVVKKTENGYIFDDLTVFDKAYDHRRYVVFNSDRTKTNILMNIFNGSYSLLPDSILQQIPVEYIDDKNSNLYGKLAKIMMITQSGAEGISLKNVRRVLIMEYFWNSVRINQVIGRAVRACSHQMLPEAERNVQIFTYIMSFTKRQMDKDFTLKTLDKELTTDQHILQLATKKDFIVNQFLNMLKAASFDCIINSVQNKPIENGYKCYNWAINVNADDLAYTENIEDDHKIQKHQRFQMLRKNTGVVVSKNGQKYVMLNNKLYDYFSYKNAGVLLPV
jgi:superfamily II DNA or RNA helicase